MLGGLSMPRQSENFEQLQNSLLQLLSRESLEHLSYSELYDLQQFLSIQIEMARQVQLEKSDNEWALIEDIFKRHDSPN